jgi:hypothetical protein
MSRAESNSLELDSMEIGSAQNLTQVQIELFFQFEFGSFKIHEKFGSTR